MFAFFLLALHACWLVQSLLTTPAGVRGAVEPADYSWNCSDCILPQLLPIDPVVQLDALVLMPPTSNMNLNQLWVLSEGQYRSISRRMMHPNKGCGPCLFKRWNAAPERRSSAHRRRLRPEYGFYYGFVYGSSPTLEGLRMRPSPLPLNIRDACGLSPGEVKIFDTPSGRATHLYSYGRGCGNPSLVANLSSLMREEYQLNAYKNFVCRLNASTGSCIGDAILLHYREAERPEPSSPHAKNFLLFPNPDPAAAASRDALLAIALIQPHHVYRVDQRSGLMELLVTSHADLGFVDPIGLSGGPVELPKGLGRASGLLLVAGHVRRGGWHNATRMTFFYACEPRPPFAIRFVTPLITFGFSATLEYLTHLQLVRGGGKSAGVKPSGVHAGEGANGWQLLISVGIEDCTAVLLRLPLSKLLPLLQPVGRHAAPGARQQWSMHTKPTGGAREDAATARPDSDTWLSAATPSPMAQPARSCARPVKRAVVCIYGPMARTLQHAFTSVRERLLDVLHRAGYATDLYAFYYMEDQKEDGLFDSHDVLRSVPATYTEDAVPSVVDAELEQRCLRLPQGHACGFASLSSRSRPNSSTSHPISSMRVKLGKRRLSSALRQLYSERAVGRFLRRHAHRHYAVALALSCDLYVTRPLSLGDVVDASRTRDALWLSSSDVWAGRRSAMTSAETSAETSARTSATAGQSKRGHAAGAEAGTLYLGHPVPLGKLLMRLDSNAQWKLPLAYDWEQSLRRSFALNGLRRKWTNLTVVKLVSKGRWPTPPHTTR